MLTEEFRLVQHQFPWLVTGTFGVLGAIVGSFLNVCIYRMPHGKSVVYPGSHCACGKAIPWYRNVPVFSWFVLRGRAPCCGRSFSFRYPLVEFLTGILFALCWHLFPWQQAIPGMVLVSFLIVLAFIDLDTMWLPDRLNGGLAIAGVLFSAFLPELHGNFPTDAPGGQFVATLCSIGSSLAGMMLGAGLILWIRFFASSIAGREAMGEGDVILCGGIGAFCGWQGALFSLLGGAVLGSIVMIPLLLLNRLFPSQTTRLKKSEKLKAASLASLEGAENDSTPEERLGNLEIPFGPWLALGALAWFFLRPAFPPAYLRLWGM